VSEPSSAKPYAVEQWWHRLLRVFGYVLIALVLLVSLSIFVDDADYFTYRYSFEPHYKEGLGEEFDCHSYDSIKTISCGAFSDGEQFLKYYLSVTGEEKLLSVNGEGKLRDGQRTVNDFFADLRAKGHKDSDLAVSLIGDKGYTYRREKHWDPSKLTTAVLKALAVSFGVFIVLFSLYKATLFIVHGHTLVRREIG